METTFETTTVDAIVPAKDDTLALWNPTAAALWSLLFSPALGAWLVMRNWQRLGKPDKARQALCWFVGVLVLNLGKPHRRPPRRNLRAALVGRALVDCARHPCLRIAPLYRGRRLPERRRRMR